MLKRFRDWSIRRKLTGLLMLMAFLSAAAVALCMAVFDLIELRRSMERDMATLAEVLGRNSTGALTFGDAEAGRDVLQALEAEPSVTAACIYTKDGRLLAEYVRRGVSGASIPIRPERGGTLFQQGRMKQFRNIEFDGETAGTIYIESDLQRFKTRMRQYQLALVITLVGTLGLALVLSPRFQRPISRPLLSLVATARKISYGADYSIRARLPNRDEFGALVSAFNGMLEQIERRDHELQAHRGHLEEEVAKRTAEVSSINAQLQEQAGELRKAEEKYRRIFEDAVVGIFQVTPQWRPISVNRALAEMHGFQTPEQFLAETTDVSQQVFVEQRQVSELKRMLEEAGVVRAAEIEVKRRDGQRAWVVASMRGVRDAQRRLLLYEGTLEDITDRKTAEARVEFLAYYDALTGLPNRALLQDRLAMALAGARRRSEKVALLFLDLDRFKLINDSLGHSFGDALLQQVAERLKTLARAQDTVARIGGDEFLMLVGGVKAAGDAAIVAERIVNSLSAEFSINGRTLSVSCSVGISLFPDHGPDAETLVRNADTAMYSAKENGRNRFRFFTDDMNASVVERLTLENDLRGALDRGELFLVYQPQIELATGEIIGMEALLRWRHPNFGLVPTDKLIRTAENSGLILPIGEWVLQTACLQAREWQLEGLPAVPVAVNVSAVQFRQEGFDELISRVLLNARLAPEYLELELTESLLLSHADLVFSVLQQLEEMGVKLAIDDFGTGYSSLSYLRHLPVSKLKIDRSFIRDVAADADDAAIVSAIISMAKSLNLHVIAEGVEDEAQLEFLRAQRCDQIQGFYYSKPVSAEEMGERLRRGAPKAMAASAGWEE